MATTNSLSMNDLRRQGYGSGPSMGSGTADPASSSFGNPVTNSFFGINYMQTPLPVPMNKDHYGLTFFTRPQLNMQSANLKNVRKYYPLLTTEMLSVHRAVRCMLDPRLQVWGDSQDVTGDGMGVDCPLIDPLNAFMPLLTNHLESLSGFPDVVIPHYDSPEGQYRESQSIVDGTAANYSAYNITASFRNSRGDPITKIFDFWEHYATHVFEGLLVPYSDMLIANVIDYNTRIYRLLLDPSKTTVVGIAACGAAFPTNIPRGSQFDYNIDKPYNDANAKVQIQFQANGAIWDDEILVWSFNHVVGCFNPGMTTAAVRAREMVKVPRDLMSIFNCRAYPRINPQTRELEWWVTKSYYNSIAQDSKAARALLDALVASQPVPTPRPVIKTGNKPQLIV